MGPTDGHLVADDAVLDELGLELVRPLARRRHVPRVVLRVHVAERRRFLVDTRPRRLDLRAAQSAPGWGGGGRRVSTQRVGPGARHGRERASEPTREHGGGARGFGGDGRTTRAREYETRIARVPLAGSARAARGGLRAALSRRRARRRVSVHAPNLPTSFTLVSSPRTIAHADRPRRRCEARAHHRAHLARAVAWRERRRHLGLNSTLKQKGDGTEVRKRRRNAWESGGRCARRLGQPTHRLVHGRVAQE